LSTALHLQQQNLLPWSISYIGFSTP